jgi:Ca2+/H+ antiporter
MAVLGLVLPSFTVSSPGPTLSPLQSTFLILMSVGLYGVFLGIQTRRHRDYFVSMSAATVMASGPGMEKHGGLALRSVKYHGLLLRRMSFPLFSWPNKSRYQSITASASWAHLLLLAVYLWRY